MIRAAIGLVLLLAATTALAIPPPPPADLSIRIAFEQSSIGGGDRGTLRMTVQNAGPYPAHAGIAVGFGGGHPQPVTGAGWRCTATRSSAECVIDRALQPGDTVVLELPFVAGAESTGFEMYAGAEVNPRSGADPNRANNADSATLLVRPTQHVTDAAVHFDHPAGERAPLAQYARTITVENKGLRRISSVTVYITTRAPMDIGTTSPDWTCMHQGVSTACTYAGTLSSGQSAGLPIVFTAPYPGTFEGGIGVVYAGGIEATAADNYVSFAIEFGVTEDFEAVLVPFLAANVTGALGSVWSSEISAHSTSLVPVLGPPCDDVAYLNEFTTRLWPDPQCPLGTMSGALVYVARAQRDDITFSGRLYESAELVAQLPIVRGDDFRSRVILTDIPRSGTHRYSLRIYSLHADPPYATVHVYGEPGFTMIPGRHPATRSFTRESGAAVGPSLLRYPAYAEVEHDEIMRLLALADAHEHVSLTVEGWGPLWAMLVMVDNATQRPVFITPQ